MKRRRIIVGLIAVIFVGVVVAVVWPREGEPVYQGKKLSEWLQNLRGFNDEVKRAEAGDAVRHIGTNALPFLLRWIDYEPSPAREKVVQRLLKVIPKRSAVWIRGWIRGKGWDREIQAKEGFPILGPEARLAIPRLFQLINRTNSPVTAYNALWALVCVGPESIPTIVAILNDKSRPDRADTLSVLAIMGPRFGTNASLVVSAVIGCMQEQNVEVAVEAAQTLSLLHFELEANDVVPALVAGLDHPSLRVQVASAEALGAFGQDARSAVPALEKISANSHADPAVRDMAQRVLREVLGTNAVHLE